MAEHTPDGVLAVLQRSLSDRYEVVAELGRGGMATVYRARDIKHGREVAIKVLHPDLAASLGSDRFLREIRVAAALQHPGILPLFDSGDAAGLLYYVMPLVEGESLYDRLHREVHLPIEFAIGVVRDVAEALDYAHTRGVIHRDIKPENILLVGNRAIVADFGIARAVEAGQEERLTQTGMAVGTPLYMSPEQAAGDHTLDGRADVYSLGCVLYEFLAGTPPFSGATAAAIMARHAIEPLPDVRVVRNTVPEEVQEALERATAKVPADRYATAGAFAEALGDVQALVSSERITARATAQRRRARTGHRVVERWRVWVGVVAFLVVVGAVGAVLGLRGGNRGGPGGVSSEGPNPDHVAVLYFEDLSGGGLQPLADGFTEALIGELSGVSELSVISRNGVRPFKGAAVSPDSIARALSVGTLVEGSVSAAGDKLRIRVALSDPSGREIGNTTLERPRSETFELQDDVAREVAAFLRRRLGVEIAVRQQRARTRNVAAWETAQRAAAEARRADVVLESEGADAAIQQLETADTLYTEAARLDAKWPVPETERGWLAYRRTRLATSFDRPYYDRWTREGLVHAARALRLSPQDPDALELRGTLEYWRWLVNLEPNADSAKALFDRAEADFRASVAANPTQASALTSLSHLLMNKGRTSEAKLAALRAYETDPYLTNADLTLWRLFQASLDLEDDVESSRWCDEGRRRFPSNPRFTECRLWLGALKQSRPVPDSLWTWLDRYVALSPPNLHDWRRRRGGMVLAMGLVRAGLADSARHVALAMRADATVDPTRELAYFEAIARTFLGDKDEAFRLLGNYLAANPNIREGMAQDELWWLEPLRGDPRYQTLLAPN